ncbi:MAG: LPD7 domain-containing protein [Rubrivivax sp.]
MSQSADADAQGDARGIQRTKSAEAAPLEPAEVRRTRGQIDQVPEAAANDPSPGRLSLWVELAERAERGDQSDTSTGNTPKPQRLSLFTTNSPWAAMHRLAASLNPTQQQAQEGIDRSELQDVQNQVGATANRGDTGQWELSFTNDDSRALYRQAVRERQMELARPAENSLSALPPAADRSSRKTQPRDEAVAERGELQRLIENREGEASLSRQQLDVVQQIIKQANPEQLKHLKQAAQDTEAPDAWHKALRAVQAHIEKAAGVTDRQAADRQQTTPVEERFTVSPRLIGSEYWFRDRPDRLAFTETWLTLRTAEHSSAALMGVVDRAGELGWKTVHLHGSAEFKREAWVLATSRGLQAVGYTPTQRDPEAASAEQGRRERARPQQSPVASREAATSREASPAQPSDRQQAQQRQPSEPQTTDPAQLRAVMQKAMRDARVPAQLEVRLIEALERRANKLGTCTAKTSASSSRRPKTSRARSSATPRRFHSPRSTRR